MTNLGSLLVTIHNSITFEKAIHLHNDWIAFKSTPNSDRQFIAMSSHRNELNELAKLISSGEISMLDEEGKKAYALMSVINTVEYLVSEIGVIIERSEETAKDLSKIEKMLIQLSNDIDRLGERIDSLFQQEGDSGKGILSMLKTEIRSQSSEELKSIHDRASAIESELALIKTFHEEEKAAEDYQKENWKQTIIAYAESIERIEDRLRILEDEKQTITGKIKGAKIIIDAVLVVAGGLAVKLIDYFASKT